MKQIQTTFRIIEIKREQEQHFDYVAVAVDEFEKARRAERGEHTEVDRKLKSSEKNI